MGGYAPTIGIIGTVIGLIHVLENLSDPEIARPADRRGVRRHPLGRALRERLLAADGRQDHADQRLQAAQMELLVEGITEIQAGTSPRAVRQKLTALVPPSEVTREAA